jgi:dihydroxyacid dehydratase/phosphogluconate dehydratase
MPTLCDIKNMGIREQVKTGKLTPREAMEMVSKTCKTYGWCQRRATGSTIPLATKETPKQKKLKKTFVKPS